MTSKELAREIALTIEKHIDDLEAGERDPRTVVCAAASRVLATLTIRLGVPDAVALDAYRNTLRIIRKECAERDQ